MMLPAITDMPTITLDPSINSCGVAVANPGSRDIFAARYCAPASFDSLPTGMRVLSVARGVRDLIVRSGWLPTSPGALCELVFEWPQIYTYGKGKGDPNDLVPLAAIGAALACMLPLAALITPKPAEWAGQTPKICQACKRLPGKKSCAVCHGSAWITPRGRLISQSLTPAEYKRTPDQHDVIDAVGIALWRVGRYAQFEYPGTVA